MIVQPARRIETIVVAKYGWGLNDADGRERRNLFDLLIEIKDKTQTGEWSQDKANRSGFSQFLKFGLGNIAKKI